MFISTYSKITLYLLRRESVSCWKVQLLSLEENLLSMWKI